MIEIFTDGSAVGGNPGIGGYGVAVFENNKCIYAFCSKRYKQATNNQMELRALIHAIYLCQGEYKSKDCIIYSDSAYCVNAANDWIYNWSKNGWRNSKNQTVENLEMIQHIYELLTKNFINNFEIKKVKGHADCLGNNCADALATNNINKFNSFFTSNDTINLFIDF